MIQLARSKGKAFSKSELVWRYPDWLMYTHVYQAIHVLCMFCYTISVNGLQADMYL